MAGSPQAGDSLHHGARVGEEVPPGRTRGDRNDAGERCQSGARQGQARPAACGGDCGAEGESSRGQPTHSRRGEALLRAGDFGDHGAPGAGRGEGRERRGAKAQGEAAAQTQAQGEALRARRAQPALAVGSLHVPAEAPRARLRGRLHGRSLALPGEPRDGAPPEELARDGGARARHRRLWRAARDPHRPGAPVHRVARLHRLRGGAQAQRHRAREEPASPPADVRQDRALLEDDVGGVPVADGVRRLRRLPAQGCPLRAALQLPASPPGARGHDARRSLLPLGPAGAIGDRIDGGGQCAAAGTRAAAEEALLPGGPSGRPGPDHQRERGGPQGPRRRRGNDDPAHQGERT